MKKGLAGLLCLMIVIVSAVSLTACGDKLTLDNYNKIECGNISIATMKYEGGSSLKEVKNLLGEPDSETSSTVGTFSATVYVWKDGSKTVTVTFIDGNAILKTQIGLS